MRTQRNMSGGCKVPSRAAGRDTKPLLRAVRARAGYHRTAEKSTGQPLYCDDGVRRVCAGHLLPSGVFVKKLKASHILREPQAVAIQSVVLSDLKRLGCHTIRAELDDGRALEVSLASFLRHSFCLNRGFGKQAALLLGRWQDADSPQGILPL